MPRSLAGRAVLLGTAAALVLPASALAGTITGTAYLDRNSNGAFDTALFTPGPSGAVVAGDIGIGGVAVTAYDNAGVAAGTTTTLADGTYSLTTSASGTVRIEFSSAAGYQPSFAGPGNGTSVQFVAATASGVNYAMVKPSDYCQDNPGLATCVPSANDSQTGSPGDPGGIFTPSALTGVGFDATGAATSPGGSTAAGSVVASNSVLGAVWGVGTDRQRNVFYGTFVKRHSPYGPGGATNTIYRHNLGNSDPAAVTTFVTLPGTLPVHSAANPAPYDQANPPYPPYAADGNRYVTNPSTAGYSNVYSMVGRSGLGDVDVTPDGTTLMAVDMDEAAPKLWSVPINGSGASVTAGTPSSVAIPAPSLGSGPPCIGTWHPMGIGLRDGRVLVSGVCSPNMFATTLRARTGTTVTITTDVPHGFQVGDWIKFDGSTTTGFAGNQQVTAVPSTTQFQFTGAASGTVASTAYPNVVVGRSSSDTTQTAMFVEEYAAGSWSTLAGIRLSTSGTAGLDYPKSRAANGFGILTSNQGDTGRWHSWSDAKSPAHVCVGSTCSNSAGAYAQPEAANVEIADNGDLVIGMRDRYFDQVAVNDSIDYEDPLTAVTPTLINGGYAAAETVRFCYASGTYTFEASGACGSVSGAKQPNLLALSTTKPLYYWNGFTNGSYTHAYTSVGGTAMMPGSPVLWSTAYDIDNINQQGIKAFGPCASSGTCGPAPASDGAQIAGIKVDSASATFHKGNGLGDLEIVCDSAPVQIGNRVWIDSNANGIQDPGEPVVAGVTVHLYDASNTLVGTALTDANGTYYFNSNITEPAAGESATPNNVGGGLVTGATFTIRLDNPQDYAAATSGPLAPYDLTAATQSSIGAGSQSTAVDSNATVVSNYPQIAVPARSAGFNNHTFDVGFVASAAPPWPLATLVGMGDYTWIDSNSNGVQDVGEPPLAGVQVQLLDAAGNVATDASGNPVSPVTTDAQGAYFIGNLLAGNYKAQFTLPSGYTFTTTGGGTSATDSNPTAGVDPLVGLTPVFTIGRMASGDTTAVTGHTNATVANLTIDAGVVVSAGGGSGGSGGAGGTGGAGGSGASGSDPASGGAGSGGAGSVTPSVNPGTSASLTPFQGGAVVPPNGIPVDGAGRIVVVIENPLDTTAESMTTVIVLPRGLTVVSADGGTVSGRTITYTDIDVPGGGRKTHALYLRASGKPRTVSIPVTVRVAGTTKVQRTVIKLKVRAARRGIPAVTG